MKIEFNQIDTTTIEGKYLMGAVALLGTIYQDKDPNACLDMMYEMTAKMEFEQIEGKAKTGIELIAQERQEQIEKHGRTVERDVKENKGNQLSKGASVLAFAEIGTPRKRLAMLPENWDDAICLKMCQKPHKERLIIAGALIAAEIDRLLAIEQPHD